MADQIAALEAYEELLVDHARSPGDDRPERMPDRLRDRHLVDCLRAAPLIPESARTGCDMGSGAGLPGHPPRDRSYRTCGITLVEVRRNRAPFLERVVSELEPTQRVRPWTTPRDVSGDRSMCVSPVRSADARKRVDGGLEAL